jgi:quinoprotein glucose dehydrogenase
MQYSALKQINRQNVTQLKLAWQIKAPGPNGRFSFNPLVIDGKMYVVGENNFIYALDAATGKQLWVHPVEGRPTNRGFNYWESPDRSDQRLIFAADSYLQEINLKTGLTINTFGNDGRVNLREGLGRDPKTIGDVQSGTPGRVFENLIILGSAPGEMYGSPPGDIRAYDVKTGKLAWTFHTIPHPGEFGYETWPKDAWKYIGGVNTWGGVTVDEKRGIAYFPLGSPTYDLYGADRIGANLYGNCLLALDARSGKRLWHFQFVHHDLWDYDLTASPNLLTVKHNGKNVDIIAQATKFGFLYVLDRLTGKPLWPVEERPVPKSDMPGEESWPTQPFPTKPPAFSRQKFATDDINPYLDASEREQLRQTLLGAANEGIFTPPAYNRNQIAVPGEMGGANWGSTAGDPATGMLYVRAYDAPAIHKLTADPPGNQRNSVASTPEQQGYALYNQQCIGCHGPARERIPFPASMDKAQFIKALRSGKGEMPSFSTIALPAENVESLAAFLADPAKGLLPPPANAAASSRRVGLPPPPPPPNGQSRYYGPFGNIFRASNSLIAMGPPWSSIVAYDLNEGTIKWRVPIGTTPGLAAKGIKDTGSSAFIRNGPVVTAGGLIFIGTGPDRMVHALNKDTGEMLWETELPANPDGIPAVYEVGGRQFIAFFAANSGAKESVAYKPALPDSQGYYVFALPQSRPAATK